MKISKHHHLVVTALVIIGFIAGAAGFVAAETPAKLSDQEFWKLVSDFSEADGTFHSENLVSNELRFQVVIPDLLKKATPGRVYLGVGSEQNFTYIAAVHPQMAFILDIRRGNLDLHLIYKALFETSANRVEFVSKMFSRKAPAGLSASASAAEIFAAFEKVGPSQALFDQNLKDIKTLLTTKHGFALSKGDLDGVDYVYRNWFEAGPDIQYELTTGGGGRGGGRSGGRGGRGGGGGGLPTYADLMAADDGAGKNRSFLANEDNFKFLKDLQTKNLVVPVVGNFAGPKALLAISGYLKEKKAVVSAFYLSNVEQYLREDGIWGNFCASAATLPTDATSTFIRSVRGGFNGEPSRGGGSNFASSLGSMKTDLASCPAAR
jgi:hypothetical protein